MTPPLLRVENLSKNFDRLPVLKEVSFSLEQGEILGLVGRQGAGRSTLFHLLGGAMRPTSGSILFNGVNRRYANRAQAQKLGIETGGGERRVHRRGRRQHHRPEGHAEARDHPVTSPHGLP